MSDLIDLSKQIQSKIDTLVRMRSELKERAINKASTKAEYEKQVAIRMIKLRNGVVMELDGETIENPPATIIEKLSRGMCWQECLAMEEAEGLYKSLTTNLQIVQAELNGLQSILRYIEAS